MVAKGKRRWGPTFRDLEDAVGSGQDHLFCGLASEQVRLADDLVRDDPDGWSHPDAIDTVAGLFAITVSVPTGAMVFSWPSPEDPDGGMSDRVELLQAMAEIVAGSWRDGTPTAGS